jgi:glycerophosphoryl diester phosphodiesterase
MHPKVSIWTVNDADIMKKFIDLGVDAITTDKPELLLKELGRPGSHK